MCRRRVPGKNEGKKMFVDTKLKFFLFRDWGWRYRPRYGTASHLNSQKNDMIAVDDCSSLTFSNINIYLFVFLRVMNSPVNKSSFSFCVCDFYELSGWCLLYLGWAARRGRQEVIECYGLMGTCLYATMEIKFLRWLERRFWYRNRSEFPCTLMAFPRLLLTVLRSHSGSVD